MLTTSSLTAGSHAIQALYASVNGFGSSIATLTETVIAPSYTAALDSMSKTISRGASGSATVTITPTGGYTGSFTVACGTVPTHFSCAVASPMLSLTGTGPVSTTITLATNAAALVRPAFFARHLQAALACLGLPLLGGAAFALRRSRRLASLRLLGLLAVLFAGSAAFNGCGGDKFANDTPAGSYQVPVVVTPATGTATTLTLNVTVQ